MYQYRLRARAAVQTLQHPLNLHIKFYKVSYKFADSVTAVLNTIDISMASVSSLQVLLVLGLFSYCLVYGEPNNTVREVMVDGYVETVVKPQLDLMKAMIKAEVEKLVEEKLNKRVNEKEQNDLKKATEGKYKYIGVRVNER